MMTSIIVWTVWIHLNTYTHTALATIFACCVSCSMKARELNVFRQISNTLRKVNSFSSAVCQDTDICLDFDAWLFVVVAFLIPADSALNLSSVCEC